MTGVVAAGRVALCAGLAALCGLPAACGSPPKADGSEGAAAASAPIAVGGAIDRPGSLSLAELRAVPAVTQTVRYGMGAAPKRRTFTGADLWSLLESRGIQTDAAVEADVLRKYVVATGSDGYRAAFSLGELKPDFGNRGSLVAYAELVDGARVALKGDEVRVTAPGDVRSGRYVSSLVRLDVRASVSTKRAAGGGASTRFEVSGAVLRPTTFDLAALQALPAIERRIGTSIYRGVTLWNLLGAAGFVLDPKVKGDVLGRYVVSTGSDGYQALFALGELDPGFGAQPNLVAYEVDGAAVGARGFARLVVPNDARRGRWVANLVSLEVFAAP
ncbi:MAG TPA: molybdopterin-binding oxidoreductase [Burkholderiaceae bacterium]|nr:molybdopterin-binding oxidoreductase [Burkholderiaceae bacterium]